MHNPKVFALFMALGVCMAQQGKDEGATIVYSHRLVRSNSDYEIIANSFQGEHDADVTATIKTPQGTWESGSVALGKGEQKKLTIKIPNLALTDKDPVHLTVKVAYKNGPIKPSKQRLQYVPSEEIILIQLDKPMYKATDPVRFRVLILDQDLKLSNKITTISAVLKFGLGYPLNGLTRQLIDSGFQSGFVEGIPKKITEKQTKDKDPTGEPLEQKKEIPYAYPNYPGYFEGSFAPFCNEPVYGNWTLEVVAGKRSEPKIFSVSNYRLPRFAVSFSTPSYLTKANDTLPILLAVRDQTGNPVIGEVNIVVEDPSSSAGGKTFPPQAIEQLKDPLTYRLDKLSLDRRFCQKNINGYLTIKVTASEAISKKVEQAEKRIPYHCHPFLITTSTITYQPGLESTATIRFVNHDGTPVADDRVLSAARFTVTQLWETRETLTVKSKEVDVPKGMVIITFHPASYSKNVTITVEVQDTKKTLTLQTRSVEAAASIRIFGSRTYRVGETVQFQLGCNQGCGTMYYAVISKKGIKEATSVPMDDNEESARLRFVVTADMAPSATIIAYYALNKEVPNDAVEIFVEQESAIENVDLKVGPEDTRETYVVPGLGKKVKIEVTGAPNSLVGLLAVDKNLLQLSSGHDISASEIAAQLSRMDAKMTSHHIPPTDCEVQDSLKESCSMVFLKREFLEANLVVFVFEFDDMHNSMGNRELLREGEEPLLRKDFRDSFMFVTKFTDNNGKLSFLEPVPDSITTWAITAFTASPRQSMGITKKPSDLRVYQEVYIHMDLPATMIVNETTIVNMTLFNFRKGPISKTLAFRSNVKLNNVDTRLGNWSVDMRATQRNAFWLFPIAVGPFTKGTVTITAELYEPNVGVIDKIQKKIQILQPGSPTVKSSDVYTLSGSSPNIEIPVDKGLLPVNIVPESVSVSLTVFGDTFATTMNQLTLPDMSKEFEGLIRIPHGCGEQTMAILMPNVFLARYLRTLGPQALTTNNRLEKLRTNMKKGFDKQANFRLQDGSYNTFGRRRQPGSTWLTAYVVRGLSLAGEFIKVDQTQIDKSIRFLDGKQNPDGAFREDGTVIDRHLQGAGGQGDALTAFVLLAYVEAGRTTEATRKAKAYLERTFNNVRDPYTLGLTCYAFSRLASPKTRECVERLNSFAKEPSAGKKCWLDATSVKGNGQQFTAKDVETTSYALLALCNSSYDGNLSPVVDWLLSQRNGQGGFKSTQDTIVALNALSELKTEGRTGSFEVEVNGIKRRMSSDSMDPKVFPVEPTQTKVDVKLNGQGTARCQLEYKYNEIPKVQLKTLRPQPTTAAPAVTGAAPTSELDLKFTLRYEGEDDKKMQIELCPSYQGSVPSGMVTLEIDALTGYSFNAEAIKDEINPEANELQNVECAAKCTLYFRKIDSGKSVCVTMPLYQSSETDDPKPRPIIVYRYYEASSVKKVFEYSLKDVRQ